MMQYSNTTQQLSPTPSMTIREQQLADPETRLTALAAAVTFLLSNDDNYNNNYTCKQKKRVCIRPPPQSSALRILLSHVTCMLYHLKNQISTIIPTDITISLMFLPPLYICYDLGHSSRLHRAILQRISSKLWTCF